MLVIQIMISFVFISVDNILQRVPVGLSSCRSCSSARQPPLALVGDLIRGR